MVKANLDLYDITFDFRFISVCSITLHGLDVLTITSCFFQRAVELQRIQDELFYDEATGGYFTTASKDSAILFRMKNAQVCS